MVRFPLFLFLLLIHLKVKNFMSSLWVVPSNLEIIEIM